MVHLLGPPGSKNGYGENIRHEVPQKVGNGQKGSAGSCPGRAGHSRRECSHYRLGRSIVLLVSGPVVFVPHHGVSSRCMILSLSFPPMKK